MHNKKPIHIKKLKWCITVITAKKTFSQYQRQTESVWQTEDCGSELFFYKTLSKIVKYEMKVRVTYMLKRTAYYGI
jgi:hypothetical protein